MQKKKIVHVFETKKSFFFFQVFKDSLAPATVLLRGNCHLHCRSHNCSQLGKSLFHCCGEKLPVMLATTQPCWIERKDARVDLSFRSLFWSASYWSNQFALIWCRQELLRMADFRENNFKEKGKKWEKKKNAGKKNDTVTCRHKNLKIGVEERRYWKRKTKWNSKVEKSRNEQKRKERQ